jgi:hypothetical protein
MTVYQKDKREVRAGDPRPEEECLVALLRVAAADARKRAAYFRSLGDNSRAEVYEELALLRGRLLAFHEALLA